MTLRLLGVIPARGGSKGLPRKSLQPIGGMPLVGHAIELARLCPELDRVVVSTDSAEIASVATAHGAEVVDRPHSLAGDDAPMWPTVRHALDAVGEHFDAVVLLQPTSPFRLPLDVAAAAALLESRPDADGVISVSEPAHHPIWSAMTERDGRLVPLFADAYAYTRRQELPPVVEVNGAVFAWRTSLIQEHTANPGDTATYVAVRLPRLRAVDIDDADDLAVAEALLRAGLVSVPWLPEAS